jgi:hypothetical protein
MRTLFFSIGLTFIFSVLFSFYVLSIGYSVEIINCFCAARCGLLSLCDQSAGDAACGRATCIACCAGFVIARRFPVLVSVTRVTRCCLWSCSTAEFPQLIPLAVSHGTAHQSPSMPLSGIA